jgi:hypothetical protein
MIINLTQHPATQEQKEAGVLDVAPERQKRLHQLLTFEEVPSIHALRARAAQLFHIFEDETSALNADWDEKESWPCVMIGGAPYLMSHLEECFISEGITVVYAFSQRKSVEEPQADGSVVKRTVFVHEGFVEIEPQ